MKFLKITLGIITALVICFLLLGIFSPTVSYTIEMEANKPLKESWAVFTDESKTDQWVEGLKSTELISGTKNEVGAVSKITIDHDGEIIEMTEKLTAVKEMEQYAMEFDNEVMINNVDVRFTAKDDNTTLVNVNNEIKGKGPFFRSLFVLMKGTFQKGGDDMYARLKTLIEENTTDYFPEPVMEADASSAASEAEEAQ